MWLNWWLYRSRDLLRTLEAWQWAARVANDRRGQGRRGGGATLYDKVHDKKLVMKATISGVVTPTPALGLFSSTLPSPSFPHLFSSMPFLLYGRPVSDTVSPARLEYQDVCEMLKKLSNKNKPLLRRRRAASVRVKRLPPRLCCLLPLRLPCWKCLALSFLSPSPPGGMLRGRLKV